MEDRLMELLPCPFCNAVPVLSDDTNIFYVYHSVDCYFSNPHIIDAIRIPEVARRWNTRATDPLLEKMAEALTRIDQWDWPILLKYADCCDMELFGDLENVSQVLKEYRKRKDAK